MKVIIGIKKGMVQQFNEDWRVIPVTRVDVGSCRVVLKRGEKIWIGCGRKRGTRAERMQYKLLGYVPKYVVETTGEDWKGCEVGQPLPLEGLEGSIVDVVGVSKGKGFTGVVKRFNTKGGPKTHGQSDRHRAIGSIGAQTPGKVWKGQKMPGRAGGERVKIKNLRILNVDKENGIVNISGSLPGANNSFVVLYVKKTAPQKSVEIEKGEKERVSGDKEKKLDSIHE